MYASRLHESNPRVAAAPNEVRAAAFGARIVIQPNVARSAIRSSHWERHRAVLAPPAAYESRRPSSLDARSGSARQLTRLRSHRSSLPRKLPANDLGGGVIFRIA